uniref:rRNA methyltransferase 1, mitochondrial n=1 Tax=Sphenodon punctatus TaxID=8508 RepID=A0A8D0G5P8_SPHPU
MQVRQAFKFSIWKAARLSFAFSCSGPFRTGKHFSTQEKKPLEQGPPSEFRDEEKSDRKASHQLQTAPCGKAAREIPKSHPSPKSHKHWTKSKAAWASEEFRQLRDDDFKEKKRPPRKSLSIEMTKGSEILFGIAPCSLALSQPKRNFFRMFLKLRNDSRTVMEEFAQRAEARGIPVEMVKGAVLTDICKGGVHQGVCLEATPLHPISLEKAPSLKGREAAGVGAQLIWLVLEGIQDPMNLGAVLRSAHFLGVDKVVMSLKNSCPLTPVVSKASSGIAEVLDVFGTDDLHGLLKEKSEQGWQIIGTTNKAESENDLPVVSCSEFRWTGPTLMVLGNEGFGLSPAIQSLCHKMLTILPGRELHPGTESLNVSVAAGILLHSICIQKDKTP